MLYLPPSLLLGLLLKISKKQNTMALCKPGDNFFNDFCTHFSYKRHFGSFFCVHVTRKAAKMTFVRKERAQKVWWNWPQWFPNGVPWVGPRVAFNCYNSLILIPIKPARGYLQSSLLGKGASSQKRLGNTVVDCRPGVSNQSVSWAEWDWNQGLAGRIKNEEIFFWVNIQCFWENRPIGPIYLFKIFIFPDVRWLCVWEHALFFFNQKYV